MQTNPKLKENIAGSKTFFGVSCKMQISRPTDNGHPERAFFQKIKTLGLGQTTWAEIFWGILGISKQTIGAILAL